MNFEELIEKVKHIPYGRNSNRSDFSLVLKENKGTCSSKHAFLKEYADENNIENVKLFIGVFKMNEINTPKITPLLSDNAINYIPEAHCYIKIKDAVIDVTNSTSFHESIKNDILEEIEIEPKQVVTFKVDYHQNFIKKWCNDEAISISFDEIWAIREVCIQRLAE